MITVFKSLFLFFGLKRQEKVTPKKRNAKSFSKAVKQSMRQDVNELVEKMKAA